MGSWATIDETDEAARAGVVAIGAAIRAGRLSIGMSQRQLAFRARLAQSTISRLEAGALGGMRFRNFARVVGVIRLDSRFPLPDEPAVPTRRLPGQPRLPRADPLALL